MTLQNVVLAILRNGPAHGYAIKRQHDEWYPDARPLAFGQVYATLSRLHRDGLVDAVATRSEGGPEKTVYALTPGGEKRLAAWLEEPSPPITSSSGEIVRKGIAALKIGHELNRVLSIQRTVHLRRIRHLQAQEPTDDLSVQLARDHVVAHLDADLRWLDLAAERAAAAQP